MGVTKKIYGVQGYKNPTAALKGQAEEISKALEYLRYTPFKDGVIKSILKQGSQPLVDQLQQEYLKSDPSGMAGRIGIFIDVVPAKRRMDTVYIGPAKKISRGWRLWYILQYGYVKQLKNGGQKVVPGKRFMDRAVSKSKSAVIALVGQIFEKKMAAYALKLGFDVKSF